MAAEHNEDSAQGSASGSKGPNFKLTAQECIAGEGSRGTGSWSILKDLHMSILDGGVSILKRGLQRLSGAVRSVNSQKSSEHSPSAEKNSIQTNSPLPADRKVENSLMPRAEPATDRETNISSDEEPAYGVDWIDNLLEELDATELAPGEPQAAQPRPAQDNATGRSRSELTGDSATKRPIVKSKGYPGF